MTIRFALLVLLTTYFIFGISASALEGFSRIGTIAAVGGFIGSALLLRELPRYFLHLCAICLVLSLSWLWSSALSIDILGNYLTASLAAVFFVNLTYLGIIGPREAISFSLIPFAVNLQAYIGDVNYVEVLYELDPIAALKRFGGYVGHPNSMVTRLVVPLILMVLYVDVLKWDRKTKVLCAAALASAIFAIYASGSKKSAVVVAPCLLALLNYAVLVRRVGFRLVVPIGLIILAVLVYFPASNSVGEIQELEVFKRFEAFLYEDDESTIDRQDLVRLAFSLISESPFFGYGLGEFAVASGVGYYSHNNYTELMVSSGIVGLVVYVYVFWGALIRNALITGDLIRWLCVGITIAMLDITGVSYADRGSQLIVATIVFLGTRTRFHTEAQGPYRGSKDKRNDQAKNPLAN